MRPFLVRMLSSLFFVIVLSIQGCGQIETDIRTTVVIDTMDVDGPYQVLAAILGDPQPTRVYLVYSIDEWQTPKAVEIVQMEQVDPSSNDMYKGSILGQKAGTTISYYILVQEPDSKVTTDPEEMTTNVEKLIPQKPQLTYKFRILKQVSP